MDSMNPARAAARSFGLPWSQDPGTIWIPVRNSFHIVAETEGKGVAKVSIHMDVEDMDLLDKHAAIENKLLKIRYEREKEQNPNGPSIEPKITWSRKETAERFLHAQCGDLRQRLKEQVEAVGEMPLPSDEKAVAKYAADLDRWLSKKQQRG